MYNLRLYVANFLTLERDLWKIDYCVAMIKTPNKNTSCLRYITTKSYQRQFPTKSASFDFWTEALRRPLQWQVHRWLWAKYRRSIDPTWRQVRLRISLFDRSFYGLNNHLFAVSNKNERSEGEYCPFMFHLTHKQLFIPWGTLLSHKKYNNSQLQFAK